MEKTSKLLLVAGIATVIVGGTIGTAYGGKAISDYKNEIVESYDSSLYKMDIDYDEYAHKYVVELELKYNSYRYKISDEDVQFKPYYKDEAHLDITRCGKAKLCIYFTWGQEEWEKKHSRWK